jgi:hypothetical protein
MLLTSGEHKQHKTGTYQREGQSKDSRGRELDPLRELAADPASELTRVGLDLARHPADVIDVIKGLVLPKEGVKVLQPRFKNELETHRNNPKG